jgi:D-alanyl-D-alanine carboxypeptidase (penicillin-binding protein 5/6)
VAVVRVAEGPRDAIPPELLRACRYSPADMAASGPRADAHGLRRRGATLGVLLAVALALALGVRLVGERIPPLRIQRLLAATVRIPGPLPKLDWPAGGEAAVEVEGVGGLGSSGPPTPVPIASVAKIMTAYLTLREHPLARGGAGFTLNVSAADVAEERARVALDESVLPVAAGERLSERQALQALLLPSANNVAALLAVYDAGSERAFVARMNATARALGMSSTRYTDPSGYEDRTVSTAADQLKLAVVALREPAFAAIVDQSRADLPVAGEVENYDGLVGHDGYVGVKTGSDAAAGGCLVFAKHVAVAGRRLLILGAVLGQRDGALVPAALQSAQRLGDSAAAALREGTVVAAGARVLLARGVDGRRAGIVTARALREIGWGGLEVPVRVALARHAGSLAAGQPVATVSLDAALAVSSRAVAARALPPPSLGWRIRHLL